jgi:mono/diheme cytochrome c family protein/glucose/arabinose dehydrogenase
MDLASLREKLCLAGRPIRIYSNAKTMLLRLILLTIALVPFASAQQGDKRGEVQQLLVPRDKIPPAPPLTPEQALQSFKLPDGFRIELVAAEPMAEAPIAAAFDPEGRLWVLEMRAFMPNVDGVGETAPVGRISVLDDTNGDGRMDKSTIFLDGLVMPRAFMLVRGGLLIAEPPNLWFCRDLNGDGKADEKHLVANDYAVEADPKLGTRYNPEHSANSLLWALDNWIYSANYNSRFRNVAGLWQREPSAFRGQWGLSQDDFGRLFFNSNSDQLRADLVPSHYLTRNPNLRNPTGANVQLAKNQAVWPGRVNPGVNRGYQKGQLREDGTLATFTAACGPVIYRGAQFPAEFRGNAFLAEPTGNLIRRNILSERDAGLTATNAYANAEFLTSSDERFRPVNLHNGPDGALYIVDMYHGVIQHRNYVTSYLRQQILERGLDKPTNQGRIYRVVHATTKPEPRPQLSKASSAELASMLSNPNGWWRDTAQRLLVERGDLSVVPHLKSVAGSSANALGQLHSLWTLEGMAQLDPQTCRVALNSAHSKVRAAAIRQSELLLRTPAKSEIIPQLLKLADDPNADVQLQLALTLGEITDPQAATAMEAIFHRNAANPLIRDAVVAGLRGRELSFLEHLLSTEAWKNPAPGRSQSMAALASCIFTEGRQERISRLLDLAAEEGKLAAWQQLALLDGIASTAPAAGRGRRAPRIKPVQFSAEPAALAKLNKGPNAELRSRTERITQLITWPGKPGEVPAEKVKPLTAQQQAQFQSGKDFYQVTCGACHQPHGNGQEGLAPPLVDSEWVLGSEGRLVRISLHGARGPISVKGKTYELEMPSLSLLDDEQIASLLTYIRREWGHTADPIEPATVAKIRAETAQRQEAWTEAELLKIP